MVQKAAEGIDPRIRRTRRLLQQALDKLLKQKSFDEISVQDITEAATLNRATFYDLSVDATPSHREINGLRARSACPAEPV